MNAAETRASSAIADCTPLAVVSRPPTTAEIETFIKEVSTTRTNIAIASRTISRLFAASSAAIAVPSGPQRGDHDRLDRVEPVLGLVEDDRVLRLEDLVGDLEPVHAELLEDLRADLGLPVVERRQAVQEAHL